MAQLNVAKAKKNPVYTHEGAKARIIPPVLQLRRAVMACLLWENTFYESGKSIANRISDLVAKVSQRDAAEMAIEAREKMKLRHVPLLLLREIARHSMPHLNYYISRVIQRADEMTEFLSIYWKDGRCPLSAQVKKGLAGAFVKFDEYQLAKYNRDTDVKLKDVLFMCHAKPKTPEQEDLWKRLIDGKLAVPDTWEVNLSAGKDKKETFERLLRERKLGPMALLRNLRNFAQSGVDRKIVKEAILDMNISRVLPFRFITAARHAPDLEPQLEVALFKCCAEKPLLSGHTIILIDVSGSMDSMLSARSEVSRIDAASGIAMLASEICEDVSVYTFSEYIKQVPSRRGFALRDAIDKSQQHSGTYLGQAISVINESKHDRLIVISDEQSHDRVKDPVAKHAYMINVASYKNGIGYGKWTHIDGFSEAVLDYITEVEKLDERSEDIKV